MLSNEEKALCSKLKDLILALEQAKTLYKEKDRIEGLINHISPIDLANEGILKEDNFEKKNTQWKNCAFTRWSYSILDLSEK